MPIFNRYTPFGVTMRIHSKIIARTHALFEPHRVTKLYNCLFLLRCRVVCCGLAECRRNAEGIMRDCGQIGGEERMQEGQQHTFADKGTS